MALTVLCAGIFLILTFFIQKDLLRSFDFNVMVKLQGRVPSQFDNFFAVIVDFGSMEIQGFLLLFTLFLLPLSKKIKTTLFVAYVLGIIFVLIGKNFLPQPAPPYMFHRGNAGLAFPSLHVQVESSYPSGHTFRVVFLPAVLTAFWLTQEKKTSKQKVFALGSIVFAVILMLGMVVLGKHWVSDVIGGAVLAIGLVSGVFAVSTQLHDLPRHFSNR